MQKTIYVALDLGSSRCQQTVMNADGTLRFSRSFPTSERHLRSAFVGLERGASVHLEAGELSAQATGFIRALVMTADTLKPDSLLYQKSEVSNS